jgi:hypothetical protein
MTGPEHYRAAERLLKETEERRNAPLDRTSWRVGQAQPHWAPTAGHGPK